MSRVRGQSITVVVERAIKEEAGRLGLGPTHDYNHNEIPQSYWLEFWDSEEGVRALNLFANPHYPTTFEEDEIRRFTIDHWEFFYTNENANVPRRPYVSILWSSMERYLTIWRQTKTSDYWAAGTQMASDLSNARVQPPTWPRSIKSPPVTKEEPRRSSFSRDLDDEVPF